MVMRQTDFAKFIQLEDYLGRLENKGLPLFERTLAQPDLDERRKSITSYSRFGTQLEVLSLKYTMGYSLDSIQADCQKVVDYLYDHLKLREQPLDVNLAPYMLIVWTLSCSYLLDIEISKPLIDIIPYSGQDKIVDRLINCFDRSHLPVEKMLFPRLYRPVSAAMGEYEAESRNNSISEFISGYFSGLQYYDASWCNSHQESDKRYYRHFGYWAFELAALSIDAKWDDSEYRNNPIYPKDLVDWKRNKCL